MWLKVNRAFDLNQPILDAGIARSIDAKNPQRSAVLPSHTVSHLDKIW